MLQCAWPKDRLRRVQEPAPDCAALHPGYMTALASKDALRLSGER